MRTVSSFFSRIKKVKLCKNITTSKFILRKFKCCVGTLSFCLTTKNRIKLFYLSCDTSVLAVTSITVVKNRNFTSQSICSAYYNIMNKYFAKFVVANIIFVFDITAQENIGKLYFLPI